MRIRTAAVAAVLLAAGVALTGCSSSSDHEDQAQPKGASSSPATAAADPKAALEAAVRTYSDAYFKPDPATGYAMLSAACKAGTTEDAYKTELENAVAASGHQKVHAIHVDQLSGTLARVSYTYDVPLLSQSRQPWTLVGGKWLYDNC